MLYWDLFITFLKIGAFSFGGGYAMVPFFEKEITMHNWYAASDYTKVIAIAQVLPGPFAIDSAAYIGYKVGGLSGALISSIALSLPSFTALTIITRFYMQFKANKYAQMVFTGVRPAVIGLLIGAAYIIGIQPIAKTWSDLYSPTALKALIIIIFGFLFQRKVKLNPIIFITACALIGIIIF